VRKLGPGVGCCAKSFAEDRKRRKWVAGGELCSEKGLRRPNV
jgi:hypothetical protein